MKLASTPHVLVTAGFALVISLGAYADSVDPYTVNKVQLYTQTNATGAVALSDYPYAFSVRAGSAATLHVPDGTTRTLLADSKGKFTLTSAFASKASLDAAFPNGTYTLTGVAVPTLSYSLTTESYPGSVPQITGGTWTNGVLIVNPAQSATVNFSTFAGYATSGLAGHVGFSLDTDASSLDQQVVSQSILGLPVASTPMTSATIPANTLSAGKVYRLRINFDTVTTLDLSSLAGNAAIALWQNNLEVWVAAVSGTAPAAPVITSQPASQSVAPGGDVTFTANVNYNGGQLTGTHIAWYVNGVELNVPANDSKYTVTVNGATQSLTVHKIGTADAGAYYLKFVGVGGMVSSNVATLTVAGAAVPIFTRQPSSQTIATGSTVVFNSFATGATSYRWQLNHADLPGSNGRTLILTNTTAADAGAYTVIATNSAGSVTSTDANLAVKDVSAAAAGHLINLSVRTFSGVNDQLLNVGYTIGGAGTSGSKPLLVRVTGPALAGFGVGGTMVDPTLTIQPLGSSTISASNDNWGGNATIVSTSLAVGAFGLTDPNSADAALVTSLSGGSYAALAAGKNNGTGVVLTEVYDATPSGSFTAATPRLINVSARAQVGTGDAVLIAGFVVGGTTSKTLLIRAIGPTLANFGVSGTLADPDLQLFVLGGPKIYENDNWGGSPVLTTIGTNVGAFAIGDPNSKDSVLLVTLPPGGYTAQVSSVSNETGIALVEVYEVP